MMTIGKAIKASKRHKYLGLRTPEGYLMGVNSKMVKKAAFRTMKKENKTSKSLSRFISYIPLNLNEYINCKHPFL